VAGLSAVFEHVHFSVALALGSPTIERVQKEPIMQAIVPTYAVYLALSLALTVWVARTLFKNGRVFLVDVFGGNAELADSVNHLLVVGFYLINLGYVCLALRIAEPVVSVQGSIEALSRKVGMVLVVLGAMHFFNLFVFSRIRQRPRGEQVPVMPPNGGPAPQLG
jgi:hypothetical protein